MKKSLCHLQTILLVQIGHLQANHIQIKVNMVINWAYPITGVVIADLECSNLYQHIFSVIWMGEIWSTKEFENEGTQNNSDDTTQPGH